MLGHDPRFPVDDNWHALIDELIAQLERYDEPPILVGHSLGGAVGMLAAWRRPDLARCVVMLDSPVVAGWRAHVWRLAKALGLGRKLSPGGVAQRRRKVWPSRQAALPALHGQADLPGLGAGRAGRLPRPRLDPASGRRAAALRPRGRSQHLRSLPHDMGPVLKKPYPLPIGFVAGTDSRSCARPAWPRPAGWWATTWS
jgi:pimeloyl-ACP methyl ester carboxylesterase